MFTRNKRIVKSAVLDQNLNEKLRAKQTRKNQDFRHFCGSFGKKCKKKMCRPTTAFWNLFARRTGFFFFFFFLAGLNGRFSYAI